MKKKTISNFFKKHIKFLIRLKNFKLFIRKAVKYDDGIIVNHERPLNPKTKKNKLQEVPEISPNEKINKKGYFKDFDNKMISTNTMKKPNSSNIKGFIFSINVIISFFYFYSGFKD